MVGTGGFVWVGWTVRAVQRRRMLLPVRPSSLSVVLARSLSSPPGQLLGPRGHGDQHASLPATAAAKNSPPAVFGVRAAPPPVGAASTAFLDRWQSTYNQVTGAGCVVPVA